MGLQIENWLNSDLDSSVEKCLDKFFNKNISKIPEDIFHEKVLSHFVDIGDSHMNPWTVKFLVTSKCNFRCRHCFFYNSDFYDAKDDLSHSEMMKLVSDIITDLAPVEVIISGGEPFLRDDLFEIISKFKSSNIGLYIQTNASLLNPERIKQLKSLLNPNFDIIQVSLDGVSDETHNFIRNGNVYEQTIQGIKELANASIPFSINCTVTSKNQYDLPALFELASDFGAKSFSLTKFVPFHNDQIELIPDAEVVIKATSKIIDMAKDSETEFILNLYKFKDLINIDQFKRKIDKREELFSQPEIKDLNCDCHRHESVAIMSNADVALCTMACSFGFSLGNAREEQLIDIWENRFSNPTFQKKDCNKMKCKECKYFKICLGGCPIYAYASYQDLYAPDGECNYAKMLLDNN